MTINAPAVVPARVLRRRSPRSGASPPDALRGTIQNDMLKEFIAQKEWICGLRPHLRIIRDMLVYCTRADAALEHHQHQRLPHPRGGGDGGAGAGASRSPTASATSSWVARPGSTSTRSRPRLSFFWDVHNDFFEEIAKLRAARRMWARIMRERFGAKNPRSWLLRAHAQTAGVSLVAQQPLNNVVRTTLQALAAVLGGMQSLHTNSFDETYALPTEEAATLALRTQQIIAEETGVPAVADPLGGSYFVEHLTDQMEAEANQLIATHRRDGRHRDRDRGGLPAARDRRVGLPVPAPGRRRRALLLLYRLHQPLTHLTPLIHHVEARQVEGAPPRRVAMVTLPKLPLSAAWSV